MNHDDLLTTDERAAGRQTALAILKRCAEVLRPPARDTTTSGTDTHTPRRNAPLPR